MSKTALTALLASLLGCIVGRVSLGALDLGVFLGDGENDAPK